MRRERLYLEDILTAADAIAEFTHEQESLVVSHQFGRENNRRRRFAVKSTK
jgi:uncharacterized protein with HEPN domain